MADATTVVEGKVKYREGKKWKSRWCILKKPSPVADRLQLVLYKDVHEALRAGGRVKSSFSLDGYCGLESGFEVDREENVLALLCLKQVILLAFDTRDYLIQFEVKIRRSLGQDYQYPVRLVKAPSGSRLQLEERVKLLIHGTQLCLTAQTPPRVLQCWNIADLRRYGVVEGKFCFEGGARCGKGAGVHAVHTDQADEISEILRVNSLGKASARAAGYRRVRLPPSATLQPLPPLPGLSPSLPADFTAQLSPKPGSEAPSELSQLYLSTPLCVSVESLEGSCEELAECLSLSSQGYYQNVCSVDRSVVRASPAFTVLRPRWGGDYQVVERRRFGLESCCSTPATHSPTYSNVFTFEVPALWIKKSPGSVSVCSGKSGERDSSHSNAQPSTLLLSKHHEPRNPSPNSAKLVSPSVLRDKEEKESSSSHAKLVLSSGSSVFRTKTSSVSLAVPPSVTKEASCSSQSSTDTEPPVPLPPRANRTCHRVNSEPCSSQTESLSGVSQCVKPSPPASPTVPKSSLLLSPEQLQPMLNYAEIDLSAATASPPPVKFSRQFSWRQKKPPPKLVPVAYTQIDHTATSALKRAGREHALSREDHSTLQRRPTVFNLARKNSAPVFKERKGSSSFSRDRSFSTCSMESI